MDLRGVKCKQTLAWCIKNSSQRHCSTYATLMLALGVMTLGVMTLGVPTLHVTTLGIMMLGVMTFGVTTLGVMTLGVRCNDAQCNDAQCNDARCNDARTWKNFEITLAILVSLKTVESLENGQGVCVSKHALGEGGGVSAQGVYLGRGASAQGGVCLAGVCPEVVHPSMQWGRHPPWTDRHLWKHNLRKLRLREVMRTELQAS